MSYVGDRRNMADPSRRPPPPSQAILCDERRAPLHQFGGYEPPRGDAGEGGVRSQGVGKGGQYNDTEIAMQDRRSGLYEDDRRSNIERGRGGSGFYDDDRRSNIEIGRGSRRSRGSGQSYGSSPPYSARPLEARIKHCCRVTIAFIFSNVGVCGLFVGYTIMGSFLFQAIEKDEEAFKLISVEAERNRTVEFLWNLTHHYNVMDFGSWNGSTATEVKRYQEYLIEAIGRGYDGNDDAASYDPWSFEGGFLYSLTVITTIGYGHIVPKTVNGKVMTIVYTIFGMPVFLLYMANMGDILAKSLKWTYARVCVCRRPPPEPKYQPSAVWRSAAAILSPVGPQFPGLGQSEGAHSDLDDDSYSGEGAGRPPNRGRRDIEDQVSLGSGSWRSVPSEKTDIASINIPLTVSLVILFALLYGGTELFQSFENWDPLTSFYFCFISLTTIGFGDVVPGSSVTAEKRINFIYCSLYLMFGLALLSMCFNLMQEEVVHKVTTCVKSVTLFRMRKATPT